MGDNYWISELVMSSIAFQTARDSSHQLCASGKFKILFAVWSSWPPATGGSVALGEPHQGGLLRHEKVRPSRAALDCRRRVHEPLASSSHFLELLEDVCCLGLILKFE